MREKARMKENKEDGWVCGPWAFAQKKGSSCEYSYEERYENGTMLAMSLTLGRRGKRNIKVLPLTSGDREKV